MKKSIFSLVVLMSILGTTTSFGKTNGQPRENNRINDRMEQGYNRGSHMQRDNRPQMEIEPMHREPGHPMPEPQPEPRPVVHHGSNVGDVVGGVVVGTVIGTVLGSLIL